MSMYVRLLTLLISVSPSGMVFAQPKAKLDFAHDIVPILKKHCAECHSNGKYKGSLSLDTRESILKAKVVVPGKSAKSELYRRITSKDVDERMPPKSKPLSSKEIALIKRWIDGGLPWEPGFSFKKTEFVAPLKPIRPTIPPAEPGLEHPIDRILKVYFAKHKITAPQPADEVTFIRRVYMDVIGLIPTSEEVDSFIKNNDADKRNKLARHLLGRKREYTEHWLSYWNDLLRNDYAGTGYIDGGRKQISTWLYSSIYQNKPYDQFVRELIHPTPQSEGFIRGIKWRGNVNASQVRELQFAQNVSLVFFGANMKCASCHDSFVDDWKLIDAYGMAAVTADRKLEIHRCDVPSGKHAEPKFLWPELGKIDGNLPREKRLEQLANLVTHAENGRFTRTIVNRIWDKLMGRGIVYPVDVMANRPWDETLLNYLAVYLVDQKYDTRKLVEHIITSKAYQSKSALLKIEDLGEDYVFRGPHIKRLTAEQFVDAVWQLTHTAPKRKHAPINLPKFSQETPKEHQFLRACLMKSDLLMRTLGRPNREQVVTNRGDTLTTLQALDLSNNPQFYRNLTIGAQYYLKTSPQDPDILIDTIYRNVLSRTPTTEERQTALRIIGNPVNRDGVTDLLWCLTMLPEFQLVR